jgi:hypothetical protein
VTPLQLAIVLSAVDNASRLLNQVQEKLKGFTRIGERMKAAGETMAIAAGLMRTAADALGFTDPASSAAHIQEEIAWVDIVLSPTAQGLRDVSKIQWFAIAKSPLHSHAVKQVAESVHMGLSSFIGNQQAMPATTVAEQVESGTHHQPARAEFQPRGDMMCALQAHLAFEDIGEISSVLRYAAAVAQRFHVRLKTAWASITQFSPGGLYRAPAGTRFAERMRAIVRDAIEKPGTLVPFGKRGVLDLHGTLTDLTAWIHAHPGFARAEALTKAFRIQGAGAELLARQLIKLDDAQQALEASTGAAACAHMIAKGGSTERCHTIASGASGFARNVCGFYEQQRRLEVLWNTSYGVQAALGDALSFVKQRGAGLAAALLARWPILPYGIINQVDETTGTASKVAHLISLVFLGHSPIAEVPAHHLKFSRAIALTLTPSLVLAPTMQKARAIAQPLGSSTRNGGIIVNYSPTINISGSASVREEWVKSARRHADELIRIIKDKTYREQRLRFDY